MPKILLKKSSTAGAVPTSADLDTGELAVNTADRKLFTQHSDNSIVVLGGVQPKLDLEEQTQSPTPVTGKGTLFVKQVSAFDTYTKLLLHCDGTDGSTTFTDEIGHTVTPNGNAQIDTSWSEFGTGSAQFDGNGDFLSVADSADWNFGSGDFTIDTWGRYTAWPQDYPVFAAQWGNTGNFGWIFRYQRSTNKLQFVYTTDGTTPSTLEVAWTASADTAYHIEVDKSGTNLYFFVNGTQVGTTQTLSGTIFDSTAALEIGGWTADAVSGYLYGRMDEIRISKGIARHTSNFTPPTSAYSPNTSQELRFIDGGTNIEYKATLTAV